MLKERIGRLLPTRVRRYAAAWDRERQRVGGLDQWGRMVLEDIWSDLDAETAAAAAEPELTWQQAERNALDDFAEDRARDFVGRQAIVSRLLRFASPTGGATSKPQPTSPAATPFTTGSSAFQSWATYQINLVPYDDRNDFFAPRQPASPPGPQYVGEQAICVTGEAGSGKSALFGELYRRQRQSDAFVLAHAAGASVQAASVDSMLRRWIEELATALGADPRLPDTADPETVERTFASLLGQMAGRRRVVILLDALDQFEPTTRGRYLTWLPRPWPANVRLIATAIPGDASKALSERPGASLLPLPPLDTGEACGIIEAICARYHRAFEPEVSAALIAKTGPFGPAWGNPLWLVLAVEELNLLDADDFARAQRSYAGAPAERLRALMLDTIAGFPADIPGLYGVLFTRAEELFGTGLAQCFLGLIAVSRGGWRESDFRILLPRLSGETWDELRFASLRRLFRGQMRCRGALEQWDFNHAQMRSAARAYLAVRGVEQTAVHAAIANHLGLCRPDDPLHISETMVHLIGSENWTLAAAYYGAATAAELEGATGFVASLVTAGPGPEQVAAARGLSRILGAAGLENSTRALVANKFLFNLSNALEHHVTLDARLVIAGLARQAYDTPVRTNPGNVDWQRDLSVSLNKVGDLQVAQGDLASALLSFRESLAIFDRLARSDPGNRRCAGGAGRSGGCVPLLPRQPRDCRPAGEIRSRQHDLAAQSVDVVGHDRRCASGAGRPRECAPLLPRRPRHL
jgi:hypothetical protein